MTHSSTAAASGSGSAGAAGQASSAYTSSQAPEDSVSGRRTNDQDDDSDEEDDEDDNQGDEAWEDWVEDGEDGVAEGGNAVGEATLSLFDEEKVLPTPEQALEYDRDVKGCDIVGIVARLSLDFHQIIRLINYIRANHPTASEINAIDASHICLGDDSLLAPVITDDPLLRLDIEEMALSAVPSTSQHPTSAQPDALQRRVAELEQQLAMAREAFAAQREAMESHFKHNFGSAPAALGSSGMEESSGKGKEKSLPKRDDDTHYFNSYSHNEIHEIMLKDAVRTDSYRDFILSNPVIFKDAIVLDVGCGTGILSMFCARAGAKKVYAVDASEVAFKAERNVKENGLENVVQVIRGKVEELGGRITEKVDVIVSEWMGYFLLYEAMVDSVLSARDLYLKPGGLVVPAQCSILLAALQDDEYIAESIDYWNNVYGFKMSAMNDKVGKEGDVRIYKPDGVISTVAGIKDVLMHKDTPKDSDFTSSFSLRITKAGQSKVHGFLGWFDTFFTARPNPASAATPALSLFEGKFPAAAGSGTEDSAECEVGFTTGPFGTPTHWRQTFFLLSEYLDVKEGDTIEGVFTCRKAVDNSRELEVEMIFAVAGGKQRIQVWTVC